MLEVAVNVAQQENAIQSTEQTASFSNSHDEQVGIQISHQDLEGCDAFDHALMVQGCKVVQSKLFLSSAVRKHVGTLPNIQGASSSCSSSSPSTALQICEVVGLQIQGCHD